MELYIPPPSSFLPRLPPPRPVVPAVPIVPVPDLPDTIHAPEGAYTLDSSLFPSIGTPAAPLPFDSRLAGPPAASFIGGVGGFIVAPAPPGQAGGGQTAMSFGSTVVNGQTQPAHPVRMSWVNVWFPPKAGEKGIGGLLGMGGGKADSPAVGAGQPQMPGYEPSVSSDSDSPPSSDNPALPPTPLEVPLSSLPLATSSKRMPFTKGSTAPNALPRPKNNLRSSNSTFVTRLQALDSLPKTMAEKGKGGGEMVRWGFWNLGRTFGWGEEGGKIKEPLARLTFSQVPTCHAVSQLTASPDRLDIVVGFASGDIVWIDFLLGRYTRINKGGLLNSNIVSAIHFDARQPAHFMATFADATIMHFNLFAEDPLITNATSPSMPWTVFFDRQREMQAPVTPNPDLTAVPEEGDGEIYEDSLMLWKNEDSGAVPDVQKGKKDERSPWAGKNPLMVYKIGLKNLTGTAYSPDGRMLAVVSDDGMLRLVDLQEERLTDTFAGYFGALNCVAWSPDSRFVAVGGQDDLITIVSPRESRVVARCEGHSAFVTNIAFDPIRTGGYRFGSVGEDGKLILWDFTAASLHRPRHHPHMSKASHHRIAAGSTLSLAGASRSHLPLDFNTTGGHFHAAPPRNEVPLLQPVLARVVEGNLITAVHFSQQAIVTVSRAALIKFWERPPRGGQTVNRERGQRIREGRAKERDMRNLREREVSVMA